jgi:glycosyltransferase involved in cell wall biosynthesis
MNGELQQTHLGPILNCLLGVIMNKNPLISIITVTMNNLNGLKRTLTSALTQSFSDYEIIVIDGDSSDETKTYLESINSDSVRWISEPDGGIFDAMNKGIQLSCGNWLIFMNSGDSFANAEVLANVHSYLCPDYAVVYGNYNLDNCKKRVALPIKHLGVCGLMTSHQAIFINKELCGQILSYNCRFRICSDYDLLCRINKAFPDGFHYVPVYIASTESGGIALNSIFRLRYEGLQIVSIHYGLLGAMRWSFEQIKRGVKRIRTLNFHFP